jgi:neutral amino acid transport system ATP-binding protein
MNDQVVLSTEEIVAGYTPEVDILHGVDMEVREGEVVTMVGPNGAGKSTVMKTVFGLLAPREGRVLFRGEEITGSAPHTITRKGVSYVPQLDNIFHSLTVEENLELGAIAGSGDSVGEQMERMFGLFPRCGERRRQAAGTMSGGERQMLALGRALMSGPKLLLLDEPSAGLAPAVVDQIFDKLIEINEAGISLIMVEQNARRSLAMSDYGYVLDMGRNRYEGTGVELLHDENVTDLYLDLDVGNCGPFDFGSVAPQTEPRLGCS